MSRDLEWLLRALYERDTCEPKDRPYCDAQVETLIAEALAKVPSLTREKLLAAVHPRYVDFRRAQRKPPTLPPTA